MRIVLEERVFDEVEPAGAGAGIEAVSGAVFGLAGSPRLPVFGYGPPALRR